MPQHRRRAEAACVPATLMTPMTLADVLLGWRGTAAADRGRMPMFRFELDPADLLAVRFETRPGPLDDVGGASRALRQRPAGLLSEWRRAVLPRLTPATAFSLMLHPPVGATFGFAVPMGYCLEEGLQAVLATPKAVLREEIDDFVSHQGALPGPLRDLDRGDSVVL